MDTQGSCFQDHYIVYCVQMEDFPSARHYIEQPSATAAALDVAPMGFEEIQQEELGRETGSPAVTVESMEDAVTAPTQKPFRVLRELPIVDPVDPDEYRQYRRDQALRTLPEGASEDLRAWMTEAIDARLDQEQGISS